MLAVNLRRYVCTQPTQSLHIARIKTLIMNNEYKHGFILRLRSVRYIPPL